MEHSAFLEYLKETRFNYSVQSRVDETKANRRTLRTSVALKMRNIGPMTPALDSPVKIKAPTKPNPSPKQKLFDVKPEQKNGVILRMQKFKQWQKEKQNRLQEEKGKAKPVFKVHHVEATSAYNLEPIYNSIKGKPVDAFRKKNNKAEFVPVGKHKFKPPPNIMPISTHRMNLRSKNVVSELPTSKKGGELNSKLRSQPKDKIQKLPPKKIASNITNSVVIGGKSLQIRTENIKVPSKTTEQQKKLPLVTIKIKGASKTTNRNGTTQDAAAAIQVNSNSNNCAEKAIETNEKPTRLRRKSVRIDENLRQSLLEIENDKLSGVRSLKEKEVAVTAATLQEHWPQEECRMPDKHNNRKIKQQKRNYVSIDLISSSDELPNKSEKRTKKSKRTKSTSPLMEHNKSNSSLSTAYSINSSQSDSPATPNQKDIQLTYVSPFVTMSRGKENARREHKRRSTLGGDNTKCTSPAAAAQYFRRILEQQNENLESLCAKWNAYKLENQTEEVHNMINVAIGQTELLRRKKFKQFEDLIEMCESGKSEKPIKSLDLHGYYDTMQIQIVNLEKRFENLEQLKANDWEEVVPTPKKSNKEKIVSSPKKVKAKKTIKQAKPSMALRAMIAAKRKQLTSIPDVVIDTVQTPKSKRISSLRRSVGESLKKKRVSSPGLIMMKVTQDAKNRCSTPSTLPKSILKSEKKIDRNIRKSKAVLFQESSPSPRKMLRRSHKFHEDSF